MLSTWTVVVTALGYVGFLFAIATYGDRNTRARQANFWRPLIYSLSLAVYCTSWTFFGSVGLSARSGFDFLPIYIGPIIMLAAGWPILRIIVDVSKRQNITSIADFISARYGKNQTLGALVALIAVIGVVPYISLQLKAVSFSLETMLPQLHEPSSFSGSFGVADNLALIVTIAMAGFAILFGTRHIDTTEHQHGLIQAIAVESIVKLVAFVSIGVFATFAVMGGIGPMLDILASRPDISQSFTKASDGGRWLAMTLLSTFAILLLPRQFHVAVVENTNADDVKRAAWLFPLYLVVINLFVVPIAIAGLYTFQSGTVDADTFVLALPVHAGNGGFALIAFIGGLSAATAMVIIETVALSIMVCNNIFVPLMLSRHGAGEYLYKDMGRVLIAIRRASIVLILVLAYSYYSTIGTSTVLSQTGLLSFAAVAQFAPAVFGGMMWRRGTAYGAMAGLLAGIAVWAYTLLLPSFADAGWMAKSFVTDGPFGLGALRPRMLFNLVFDPLAHGVLWSLFANIGAYIGVSLITRLSPIERLQATAFMSADLPAATPSFRLWRTSISISQLQSAIARYLGEDRAERSIKEFANQHGIELDPNAEADVRLFRFAEHLLASVVGAASSRLVLALMLERHSANTRGAMKLLDDATAAIQYNRDLLQSAIDHVRQGIAVFDGDLNLICWNRQFRRLLYLPQDMGRVGVPLDEILRTVMENAAVSENDIELAVSHRLSRLTADFEPYQERIATDGTVLEVRSSKMPDEGVVVTFADITERVLAAEALERRVEERTAELTELNQELGAAKADADAANLGKTRFIAAASHDILQPLNAARLFTSSLVERQSQSGDRELVNNVDASLEAVEEILTALLDISRLDAGAMRPEMTTFRIDEILNALAVEFSPAAEAKNLQLRVMPCSAVVRTDRRLLRRLLQNLVSNSIKYTEHGRIVMGCRPAGDKLKVQVLDTGVGIAQEKRARIFKEFERLNPPGNKEPGLGLGLSIVERIAKVLGCELQLVSTPGKGTVFSIDLPIAKLDASANAEPKVRRARGKSIAGYNVLVIDNETTILEGMTALLGGWGCNVFTAATAEEACRTVVAPESQIDIILADFHLTPEKDGLGLIEDLRNLCGRYLPAVLITADRTRDIQDRAARIDVVYMRKPVKPANLRASMARALVTRQAAE